jgi:hypothetical protein
MRKRYFVIGSLVLLALIGGSALWSISESTAHSSQPAIDGPSNPLVTIKQKARAAKDGGKAETRELVDEMVRMSDLAQEFAELDDAVKERLVAAEMNYRNSHAKSRCSEFRIVHAVNRLADRMGTPAYTRTNVFEVRRLRANLLPYVSDMQAARSQNELRKAQKHAPPMSPLETFFVAVTVIQQKRHNPEYQLTNEEWIALHGGQRTSEANKRFNHEMQRRRVDSRRSEEVRQAIAARLMVMNPFDMLSLPDEFLNTLGIER